MPDNRKHQAALDLIDKNRLQEAMRVLSLVTEEQKTSQAWNDWATVKIACGEIAAVRTGYEKAFALGANNSQAAIQLGLWGDAE